MQVFSQPVKVYVLSFITGWTWSDIYNMELLPTS